MLTVLLVLLSATSAEKVANELVKMGVPRNNIIEEPQGGVSLLTPNYERSYDRRVLVQVVE